MLICDATGLSQRRACRLTGRMSCLSCCFPQFRFQSVFHSAKAYPAKLCTPRMLFTHILHKLQLGVSDVFMLLLHASSPSCVVRVMKYEIAATGEAAIARVNSAPVSSNEVLLALLKLSNKLLTRVKSSVGYMSHSEMRVWLTRLREVK